MQGHAFITDSPTNLVHEMAIVDDGSGRLSAKNAYPRGEFFASSDERCRPVNLFSAPDGTMYIVDMYRGVVQAGGLWTDYLTDYIKRNELQLPVARGRIWRVVYGTAPNRRGPKPSLSSATAAQLVQTLTHANGWWRDTAQRLLVERGDRSVAPALTALAASAPDWRTRLHALWTLDGLDALEPASVERALGDGSADVRAAAVRLSERWIPEAGHPLVKSILQRLNDKSWTVRRQLALTIGELPSPVRSRAAADVLVRDGADPIIVDAAISGLRGLEADVLAIVLDGRSPAPLTEAVTMLAAAIVKSGDPAKAQRVIDAATSSSRADWQRLALLRGLDAGLPSSAAARGGRGGGGLPGLSVPGGRVAMAPGRGVTIPGEPTALIALGSGADDLARVARDVAAKLNWTGKPAPTGPAAPALTAEEQQRFDAGKVVFANLCAGCHGPEGQGSENLGPSLVTSKYVPANPQIAIRILVGGKEGPVGLMPPLAAVPVGPADCGGAHLRAPRLGTYGISGHGGRRARAPPVHGDPQRTVDGGRAVEYGVGRPGAGARTVTIASSKGTRVQRSDSEETMRTRWIRVAVIFAVVGIGAVVSAQRGRGGAPAPQGQNPNGMHVYIRAGLKSHGPGQHDYPQLLADWSKILTEHGAVVDGSLHFPTEAELATTDVLVMYKGDAGYMTDTEKAALEAYVKRGGGLVSFHDTLCGPDPAYYATFVGGAKKHGETNFSAGSIKYTIVDTANPIMKGMSDFAIDDEAFMLMTWSENPKIHVLATAPMPPSQSAGTHVGEVVPQIWTYEHTLAGGQPARAFVWMQGHAYANFADPRVQPMLLRGIAWAAKHPVDELVDYTPPARGRRGGN